MKKKDKSTALILFCIVGAVIIVALLISNPNSETSKSESKSELSVSTLSCDDDNPASEHETTLKTISCEEYNDIVKGSEEKLVLYARPTCGFCNKFVPVLEEIVSEYNIEINYFDIDVLSESETKEFYTSSKLMSGSEFGTPTLVILKDGKTVNYTIGYKEKDATIDWLKDNGIINE